MNMLIIECWYDNWNVQPMFSCKAMTAWLFAEQLRRRPKVYDEIFSDNIGNGQGGLAGGCSED